MSDARWKHLGLGYLVAAVFVMVASVGFAQAPPMKGVALGLYASDPDYDYGYAIKEIADTGANTVSLLVVLMQENGTSSRMYARPGRTVPDATLRRTMAEAREAGLDVMLFPIVLLEDPGEDEWRGNMQPESITTWYDTYQRWMVHYARIAAEGDAAWFSIGSELSSLESDDGYWRETIAAVRQEFPGKLLYSCNWDHLTGPSWWDALDAIGLSSYYELADDLDASQEDLNESWIEWRDWILAWRLRTTPDKPLILTEVGYPSLDGGAVYPWNYTLESEVDLEEQRRAYEAFINAWDGRPELDGVFFYEWLDFKGGSQRGYSPRGKPAEVHLRTWYEGSQSPATSEGQ
ncbi:hypothetical protein KQI84_18220 [bacterium]|nr:hypothetical protein [bacterium]